MSLLASTCTGPSKSYIDKIDENIVSVKDNPRIINFKLDNIKGIFNSISGLKLFWAFTHYNHLGDLKTLQQLKLQQKMTYKTKK